MKIYVAGPMTGKPLFNFPQFDMVSERLRAAGHEVISPADLTRQTWAERGIVFDPSLPPEKHEPTDYALYMRNDIQAVMDVDALVLLDGWEKSRGASMEVAIGHMFGKKFYLPLLPILPEPFGDVLEAEMDLEEIEPEVSVTVGRKNATV
jgi:hypothetical protein